MTLLELLVSRHNWTVDETIYVGALKPRCRGAPDQRSPYATDPSFRSGKRYAYFLEGFIARDFLDDLGASTNDVSQEACDQLIRYAIDDA
ncbi:hypothetical protein ACRQ5Q_21340 [Bradyrhizobium sp. PMVTL-01]|uniref:hypothetical protein n=1 Tax=Bradyrhizobium sp. PMVTL-01 TaxID=3434999 RepID=UPI003F70F788